MVTTLNSQLHNLEYIKSKNTNSCNDIIPLGLKASSKVEGILSLGFHHNLYLLRLEKEQTSEITEVVRIHWKKFLGLIHLDGVAQIINQSQNEASQLNLLISKCFISLNISNLH